MIALSDRIGCLFGLDQFRINGLSIYHCERTWSWTPPVLCDFDFWLVLEIKSSSGKEWSLQMMARRCFLSVPQFTRVFRRTFGTSLRQFAILQRVLRAIHLLRKSRIPIQEIAASLGYTDHYFFHRQFKALAGVAPLEVRRGLPPPSTNKPESGGN